MKETVKEPAVVHSTFVIEKSYPVRPEKVFAAFADATKKRRWFGGRNEVEEFTMDFRVGGKEVQRYALGADTPFPGVEIANEGWYQDIVPNERIVLATSMTLGGKKISASLVTVEVLAAGAGTELLLTHQGAFFEGSGGPAMREEGWKSLIDKLTKELEAQ